MSLNSTTQKFIIPLPSNERVALQQSTHSDSLDHDDEEAEGHRIESAVANAAVRAGHFGLFDASGTLCSDLASSQASCSTAEPDIIQASEAHESTGGSSASAAGVLASTSESSAAGVLASISTPGKPIVCLMVGMAGSGKTTLLQRINAESHLRGLPSYVVNLDPAVTHLPYGANIDIRDTVNYKEVMAQYQLGPNGAIVTSLNLFATRFEQVMALLEKRAPALR
jgi:hypothetical protein